MFMVNPTCHHSCLPLFRIAVVFKTPHLHRHHHYYRNTLLIPLPLSPPNPHHPFAHTLPTMAKLNVIPDDHPDRYVWVGAVTDTSFKLFIDIHPNEHQLLISSNPEFSEPLTYRASNISLPTPGVDPSIYGTLRHFHISLLSPSVVYHVGILRPNASSVLSVASVTTFPPSGVSAEVCIAFGSCQRSAAEAASLNEIAQWKHTRAELSPEAAFVMVHTGDLHYGDIEINDPAVFEKAIRPVVTTASNLFRHCAVAATWDDHDFGPNNSDADSPAGEAALQSHAALVPKPQQDHVYHAFTVANVRIVITDLRSEARGDTVMSSKQLQFLLDELQDHAHYDAIVWVSSRPWIEEETPGSDRWGGFSDQRKHIANFIASNNVDNLIMLSGDAHMLAADNGTNSCYADPKFGDKGFPVLHAAPLANVGTAKGGPYSHGIVTSRMRVVNQYGLLTIRPEDKQGKRNTEFEFNGYRTAGGARTVDDPLARVERKPVITLKMQRPFLTDKGDGRVGLLRRIENMFTKCC